MNEPKPLGRTRIKASCCAAVTMIAVLVGVWAVDSLVRKKQEEKYRAETFGQVSTIAANLRGELNSRLFLEKGMNAFVLIHLVMDGKGELSQQKVEQFGRAFMPQLLGIKNISLIEEGIVRYAYPLAGNERAIGVNLTGLPAQRSAVLRVQEQGNSVLAGPVDLVQGGVALIHRSPIFLQSPDSTERIYWGQSSLVVMLEALFREAGLYDAHNLRLAVRGRDGLGEQGDIFWGDHTVFADNPVVIKVEVPGGEWQMAAVPVTGWNTESAVIYWIWGLGAMLALMAGGLVWFVIYLRDARARLRYIGFHDAVTGVYNRAYFETEMRRLEHRTGNLAFIICDVDGLKLVNDTLGHDRGDQLLISAARIIQGCLRGRGKIARIGGDEFAAILEGVSEAEVIQIKESILRKIGRENEQHEIPLSLSMGYTIGSAANVSPRELYKEADNGMYREKLHKSQSVRGSVVQTMMKLLEVRDFITEGHADRMQDIVCALGEKFGLSSQRLADLKLLARFHDIGKVGVPDQVLMKPGQLTAEEMREMQRHCEIGYRIALTSVDLSPIADGILKHQEWWNGKGYPLGLAGEDIPLECRILTIADAYDAMTNDRPYRKAMSHAAAIAELQRQAGTQFDPQLVQVFLSLKIT